MMAFARTLSPVTAVQVVSVRSDLFPWYAKLGYVETERYPVEEYVLPERITRPGLHMVEMRKSD